MLHTLIRQLLAAFLLSTLFFASAAQPVISHAKKEIKPYKILTVGRQITIKSNKEIKHLMLWTTSGNRVVEQRDINSNTFTITIPINHRTFFLMVGLNDGKIYSEKIGVRE